MFGRGCGTGSLNVTTVLDLPLTCLCTQLIVVFNFLWLKRQFLIFERSPRAVLRKTNHEHCRRARRRDSTLRVLPGSRTLRKRFIVYPLTIDKSCEAYV